MIRALSCSEAARFGKLQSGIVRCYRFTFSLSGAFNSGCCRFIHSEKLNRSGRKGCLEVSSPTSCSAQGQLCFQVSVMLLSVGKPPQIDCTTCWGSLSCYSVMLALCIFCWYPVILSFRHFHPKHCSMSNVFKLFLFIISFKSLTELWKSSFLDCLESRRCIQPQLQQRHWN